MCGTFACAALLAAGGRGQGTEGADEYDVKAAFLLNFARFVTWPAARFENESSPFVIAVFGDDPFGRKLDTVAKGKLVGERRVLVRRFARLEDVRGCHLLFVPASSRRSLGALRKKLGTNGVLYVGESKGFALKGGLVNFYLERSKVRFEVNVKEANRAELKVSSNLLKHARIVGSGGDAR